MQQTEKYKLNLIEKTDVFSPDPLNENAEKLEGALEAVRAEAAAADAALDQRVSALELRKMVAGSFNTAADGISVINLGFSPAAVLITRAYLGGFMCFTIRGVPALYSRTSASTGIALEITETGFYVTGSLCDNYTHCFIAFA